MATNRIGDSKRGLSQVSKSDAKAPVPRASAPPPPPASAPAKGWSPKGALKKLESAAERGVSSLEATVKSDAAKVAGAVKGEVAKVVDTVREKGRSLGELASLTMNGAPTAAVQDLKGLVSGATHAELVAVTKMSDAQLAAMSDQELGKAAQQLLDPSLPERLFGDGEARSTQALRVITAHGTDAGHMDAILSRCGYLKDAIGDMKGPAKVRLQALAQANQAKPGDWAGLERYLDAATGSVARPGTTVTPLIDGATAFPAWFEAIDGAKSSVNVTSFAFHSDETGWTMAKKLAAAADRGVAVKVIYDPMGSRESGGKATDKGVYDFMRQHGVQVVAQTPGPLANHLTHRKITVVDGQTGFIGGMNIGDPYSKEWHDCHSRVTGPGVQDLQKLFVEQWKGDGGKLPAEDEKKLFPPLSPTGDGTARIIGHEGKADQNMKLAYLRAIDTAEKTINIANPYFSDPDVVSHLEAAAKRGVDVKVVLPATNDAGIEQDAERFLYTDLIASGVHVYEYSGKPMAHDKVATFDGKYSTIGSSNLDARSLANNDEANVWSSDPSVAKLLDEDLTAKDLTQSKEMTAADAAKLHIFRRKIARDLDDDL
jgi:cardiolipin synthase